MDSEQHMISQALHHNDPHVVILHDKLRKRKVDRYIINVALALKKIGYKVTILTPEFDKRDVFSDIKFLDKIRVEYCGWWIPKTFLGIFTEYLRGIKALWMAFRLMTFPPKPKPELVFLDISLIAVFMLKTFCNYKLIYIEPFQKLRATDACYEHTKLDPNLLEAKWMKLADEVIVETAGFAEILQKSYPLLSKPPKILYPPVDTGMWFETGIKIQRIIPDLLENTILFLCLGEFNRSSNLMLAVDAFDLLLNLIEDKTVTKRFHLVIAGHCRNVDEKFHYYELVCATKEKLCASQVTFLKQLPVFYEKTLIVESTIVIYPPKNDVYSDFLLKAMSLGKPIVATNKGIASKLLIHRVSGVVIEPDPRMFAVAMKKLMMSPHLQIFLGDMAKETFQKNYSFECFCENLRQTVNYQILGGSSTSSIYDGNERLVI